MTVLSLFAEVLEEALPDHDPQGTGVLPGAVGAGTDYGGAAVDAADVFPIVDDEADGAAAGHCALHGVQ